MDQPQQPRNASAGPRSGRGAALAQGLRAWAAGLRGREHARRAEREAAQRLYRGLVDQARRPYFFRELGVPDTPEGRFEIIGLHAALLMRRLGRAGEAGRGLAQALFDLMFADMDASLRELGVGDLGVGRQVKRLAGQFYARLAALDPVIGRGEPQLLAPILRAAVWHGGPPPAAAQVTALAAYLIASEHRLRELADGPLLRGEARFAGPEG